MNHLKDQRGVALILEFILVAVVTLVLGAVGYRWWQSRHKTEPAKTSTQSQTTPKTATVDPYANWKNFNAKMSDSTGSGFNDAVGVTVKYDNNWTESSTSQLTKTVSGRKYIISFQKNNTEYLAKGGAYALSLSTYSNFTSSGKTYYVVSSSTTGGSYLSDCAPTSSSACSPKLSDGSYLFAFVYLYVGPGGPGALDLTKADDQQALKEFSQIISTIKF